MTVAAVMHLRSKGAIAELNPYLDVCLISLLIMTLIGPGAAG